MAPHRWVEDGDGDVDRRPRVLTAFMNIDDYFASLERSLVRNSLVSHLEEPFTCLASDDHNGLVRGRVFFWDASFLDLYEVVSTELGYPIRVSYAYTYLRAGQRVFRYDSAPHHPEIVTFPHHKHIGRRIA